MWNRDTGGLGNSDVVDVTFREFKSKSMLDLCWIRFEAVCGGCLYRVSLLSLKKIYVKYLALPDTTQSILHCR